MACCGQRPVVAREWPAAQVSFVQLPTPAAQPKYRVAPSPFAAAVPVTALLRYVKHGGVTVRGPLTGKRYVFSAAAPVQQVDAKDVAGLLRASWFWRA